VNYDSVLHSAGVNFHLSFRAFSRVFCGLLSTGNNFPQLILEMGDVYDE